MAKTTRITVDKSYTKVAALGEWQSISIESTVKCDIIITDGTEVLTDEDLGHGFVPSDAFNPSTYGDGDVYIKVQGKPEYTTGIVAVTPVF